MIKMNKVFALCMLVSISGSMFGNKKNFMERANSERGAEAAQAAMIKSALHGGGAGVVLTGLARLIASTYGEKWSAETKTGLSFLFNLVGGVAYYMELNRCGYDVNLPAHLIGQTSTATLMAFVMKK